MQRLRCWEAECTGRWGRLGRALVGPGIGLSLIHILIIGRWLLNEPEILMMDEPTRGIDVGAKYEIYNLMNELASKGKSILFVSSEMPELIGVADRILVMSNGRVAGILNRDEFDQEEIMRFAARYLG